MNTTVVLLSRSYPTDKSVVLRWLTCMIYSNSYSPIFKVPEPKHRTAEDPAASSTVKEDRDRYVPFEASLRCLNIVVVEPLSRMTGLGDLVS